MLASRPTPNRLAPQKETHHSEIARRRKSLACGPSGNSTQTQENAWQGSTRLDQTSWLCTWLASTERIGSTKGRAPSTVPLGEKDWPPQRDGLPQRLPWESNWLLPVAIGLRMLFSLGRPEIPPRPHHVGYDLPPGQRFPWGKKIDSTKGWPSSTFALGKQLALPAATGL